MNRRKFFSKCRLIGLLIGVGLIIYGVTNTSTIEAKESEKITSRSFELQTYSNQINELAPPLSAEKEENMIQTEGSLEESTASTTESSLEEKTTSPQTMNERTITTGTWGTIPWDFDTSTGVLTFTDGGDLGQRNTSPWNRSDNNKLKSTDIKQITFTKKAYAPVNSQYLFAGGFMVEGLSNLTSFNGLSYLDTSQVTDMSYMFNGAYKLTNLDLSQFDTSQVTNMRNMFASTSVLTSLDLSKFNTSKVTNMSHMFYWSSKLTSLDVSSFDTSKVTNMNNMFNLTTALRSLDLKSFNTSQVTDMSYMFASASALTSLNLSSFNTSKVTNMNSMFASASALTSLNLSSFNTSKVTDMNSMFASASALMSLNLSSFDTSKVTTNMSYMFSGDTKLNQLILGGTFRFKTNAALPSITTGNGYTGNWINKDTNASMGNSSTFMSTYAGTSVGTYMWERRLWGTVPWDFDTGTGMLTFTGGGNLGDYTTSPWNRTDNNKLASTDIKQITFTQKVYAPIDSSYLFSNSTITAPIFSNLENLLSFNGLSYLDTSQVTSMKGMFNLLPTLVNLDLSSFTTSKVIDMSNMFNGMRNLTTLNLANFDTKTSSPDLTDMFAEDTKLSSLTLGKNFRDTSNTSNLPAVVANDIYTGSWILNTSETPIGTSTQFMQTYDGTRPGTYIWELVTDSELIVNYYIYDGKETTRSIFSELSTRTRKVATTDTVKKDTNIQSYIKTLVPTNDTFTGYMYTDQYRVTIDDASQTSITDPTFPTNKKILLNLYFTPVLTITGVDEIDFGIQALPKKVTEVFSAVTPKGQEEVALQVLNTYETTDGTGFQTFELSAMSMGLEDTTTLGGPTPLLAQLSYTTVQGLNTTIRDTATSLLTSSNYQETIPLATKGTSSKGLQLGVRPNNSEGTYKGAINWQVKVGP